MTAITQITCQSKARSKVEAMSTEFGLAVLRAAEFCDSFNLSKGRLVAFVCAVEGRSR